MRQLDILGIKITSATVAEIHDQLDRIVASGKPGIILSANAHAVNLARTRPWLARFFKQADIVHVDGGSIRLAARLWGHRIPERITWADWGWKLAGHFAAARYKLFLLGGPEGLAREAARGLLGAHPDLRVVGTHHGYFNKHDAENAAVVRAINEARPDIVWIGMGMPLQEQWLCDNHLKLHAKVFFVCGSAFKYMAGIRTRCPKWMQDHCLEWLWMLFEEPRRGLVRYLVGNPLFVLFALRSVLGNRSK
jgi:N-acetylglucosaminyldiphosphoundecaprenol N-acetyl-beta-D-mannosaminyltransferase